MSLYFKWNKVYNLLNGWMNIHLNHLSKIHVSVVYMCYMCFWKDPVNHETLFIWANSVLKVFFAVPWIELAHINAKRKKFIRPIQAEPSSRRCEDYFRILNQAILIREKCMLAKLHCQLISTGLTFVCHLLQAPLYAS